MTTTTNATCPPLVRLRVRRRWLAVVASMASATALWGIAESLLGIDLVVRVGDGTKHIDSLAVTLTSLAAGFLAWASLTLLERRTARARTVWRALTVTVLLVSLTGPLSAVTSSAMVVLLLMHLVVGAILVLALPGPRHH
jgi:hypothetical protein